LRAANGSPFLVSIQLTPSSGNSFFRRAGAQSVVTLKSLEDADTEIAWPIVQSYFSLTAAELRLLQQLVMGTSPQAAANYLKIAHEAARSQVRAIYRKTGSASQAALVSLIYRQFGASLRM
jgi:DNA-binding CsgD family transcriptional regulator